MCAHDHLQKSDVVGPRWENRGPGVCRHGARVSLCPHCGDPAPCERESCVEASTRLPVVYIGSQGVPNLRRSQIEVERKRKKLNARIADPEQAKLRRYCARNRTTLTKVIERWIQSLPDD